MLSDQEARGMGEWVVAARSWSEASQELVEAATGLALISRTLADELHGDGLLASAEQRRERGVLGDELRLLADTIEGESARQRNDYLATAARIESYRELLG